MSTTISIIILIEVLLTLTVAICFIKYEKKFVAIEDKIIFAVLRKIRSKRTNKIR